MTDTRDRVPIGTPITTAQAARAVLRFIRSPIVGNVDADSSVGHTLQRLHKAQEGTTAYAALSTGEQRLVDVATAIWRAPNDEGARIGVIGGLDRDNRRKVLVVLFYLHLGRDLSMAEASAFEFRGMFDDPALRP